MRLAKEGLRYQSNEKWPAIILMLQMFPIPTCVQPRLWISDVEGGESQSAADHHSSVAPLLIEVGFHDFS